MPIFRYECGDCGEEFRLLIRSSEDKIACPECGSENVEKLFSTFATPSCSSSSGST